MEVTYYFNTRHATTVWDNSPDYMVDNFLTNFASTVSDLQSQILTATTCDGSDLGTITKVELRVYAKGDGGDKILVYSGAGSQEIVPTVSPDWSSWIDATSWKIWTWGAVAAPSTGIKYDSVAKANMMYCSKVEVRVTYTPTGGVARSRGYVFG